MAQVIFAVAQQNNRATHRSYLFLLQQLVPARKVERVVHRGAPTRPQHSHTGRETLRVIGEILCNFRSGVEADHECLVIVWANDGVEKLNCRFLLELEAVAHRVARVNQQPHLQRQVGLATEAAHFRRLLIVDHPEVVSLQILYVVAVPIGNSEHYANFVDDVDDRRDALIGLRFSWIFQVGGSLPCRRRGSWCGGRRSDRSRGRRSRRARGGRRRSLRLAVRRCRLADERAGQYMKSDQKQKNARFHQIDFIIIAPAPAQEPTEKFPQRRGSPRLRSHLQRSRGRRGKPCLYREVLPPSAPY